MSYVAGIQVAISSLAGLVISLSVTTQAAAACEGDCACATSGAAEGNGSTGFPDASNTGVPPGTQLTDYTGPMMISEAGTVIEGKIITDQLLVTAPDVVIKNCVVKFGSWWGIQAENGKNITVQNCTFIGPGYSGESNAAILGAGTFIGNNISKSENGIVLSAGSSTVRGNYIHDLEAAGEPHYDGISVQGGQRGVLIEGNTVDGRQTSNIFIKTDFGSISDVTVNNNLLIGDAGYAVYSYGNVNGYTTTGVKITNNHVEKGNWDYYAVKDAETVFSGNIEYPNNQAPKPGDVSPDKLSSACASAVVQP